MIDWPRQYYQDPGGKPFLFYVVFGTFSGLPALSQKEFRSHGVFPGLQLSRSEDLDQFRRGYLWEELKRENPGLAEAVQAAKECLVLQGELEDQSKLNYLRDTVGLLTFLLKHGGIAIYDPHMFRWWQPVEWEERIFQPNGAVPHRHVVVLKSEEDAPSLTWFHTRGLRKFGRPDLSVHGVPEKYHEAVIDLFDRFIEFQAFGGIIEEGQEIRMTTLPHGMMCHHAGDPEDPDFNNVHVEITPPGEAGTA